MMTQQIIEFRDCHIWQSVDKATHGFIMQTHVSRAGLQMPPVPDLEAI